MKQNIFGVRARHLPTMAIALSILQPLMAFAATTPAKAVKATLYDLDSQRKNPLFYYERTENGGSESKQVEARFTDPKGAVVASEKLNFVSGAMQKYDFAQQQKKESGFVEFRDGRYKMSFTNAEGKTRVEEADRPENLVVGPMILSYLADHWNQLLGGQDIPVRILVLDRLDTFGFKFRLDAEEQLQGKAVLRVKLKPTSFFISAVVPPIYFYFDKATRELLFSKGRTLLRYQRDDKWQDLIAETVFEKSY